MKKAYPYIFLFFIGASWGLTVPLAKIAVSDGYQPFGLMFWQMIIILHGARRARTSPNQRGMRAVHKGSHTPKLSVSEISQGHYRRFPPNIGLIRDKLRRKCTVRSRNLPSIPAEAKSLF